MWTLAKRASCRQNLSTNYSGSDCSVKNNLFHGLETIVTKAKWNRDYIIIINNVVFIYLQWAPAYVFGRICLCASVSVHGVTFEFLNIGSQIKVA